ncbi:MAG: LOG family protein [Puniceicoccales bacterium]|jgi:uncharacterized protein (TIGR00730 family)|nr:LOG family protein [Puniceicoccales bacterium]
MQKDTIHNPPKAYDNPAFIHGPMGRPIRVLCELDEPRHRFARHGVRDTIVFFGSARILPTDVARARLDDATAAAAGLSGADAGALLGKARRACELSQYYEAARELAADLVRWGRALPDGVPPFHICSGGGPGIMEAANRGAVEAGGTTLGLGISLPYEQANNGYVSPGLGFEFHYFFIRKFWFVSLARAMVIFPGGFGTMDEFFELLTLVQTRKTRRMPIVLFGAAFWNELINFEAFRRWGLIDDGDLDLFHVADSVAGAREYLVRELSRPHAANPQPGAPRA